MSGCEISSHDKNTTGSNPASFSSTTRVCGVDRTSLIKESMVTHLRGRIVKTLKGLEIPPIAKGIS